MTGGASVATSVWKILGGVPSLVEVVKDAAELS